MRKKSSQGFEPEEIKMENIPVKEEVGRERRRKNNQLKEL